MAWNQKFLIKIEQGLCEQTYKVPELDVAGLEDLKSKITTEFLARAVRRFVAMNEDLDFAFGV